MVPHLGHAETMVVVVSAGVFMCIGQDTKTKILNSHCLVYVIMHLQHVVSLELTFAGRHTIKPLVINMFVAGTSTVLKPSTARSTTTSSAGFPERAAFGACHRFSDR